MNEINPIIISSRKGSMDDPFVDITENIMVLDNIAILKEIPSRYNKVLVDGGTFKEIVSGVPSTYEFLVDYRYGTLVFNPDMSGGSVTVEYKGVGVANIPASRVYTNTDGTNVITETLEDVIANSQQILELVDGNNQIWHDGNFDPASKSDIGHGHPLFSDSVVFEKSPVVKTPMYGGSGPWVKGMYLTDYENNYLAQIGAYGQEDVFYGLYVGFGTAPWDNKTMYFKPDRTIPNKPFYYYGDDTDIELWSVSAGWDVQKFGYTMKYIGTGSGNDNALELWSDNQIGTDPLKVYSIKQDGHIDFVQNALVRGYNVWHEGNFTPNNKAELDHVHTNYIETSLMGVLGGVATLNDDGVVPSSQISSQYKEIKVVDTIGERDSIMPYEGLRVHVLDASNDDTVTSGWAEYLYTGSIWTKTAENESIDVVLSWGNISSKPSSYPPSSHSHDYLPLTGGVIDGGTYTGVNIKSSDSGQSYLGLYGDSQGTGIVYVGQSISYGGGMYYNGDSNPAYKDGEQSDALTFFTTHGGIVCDVKYNSTTMDFKSTPTVDGVSISLNGHDHGLDYIEKGTTHLYMSNGDGFVWDDTNNIMKVRKDGLDYEIWDSGNQPKITTSSTPPSDTDGNDGDVWFVYTP